MAPSWLQILKDYIGYEGATSLADKMTAARAGYLDNINNSDLSIIPNISTLSAARIGYLDNINQVGLLQITAVRAGYLDNIDNANLSTIPDISSLSAARIGYLDQLDFALQEAIAAIPTTAMRGTDSAFLASVGGLLNDAAAAGAVTDADTAMAYIKQLVTAAIANATAVGLIPTTAMRGTDGAALVASGWDATLATILDNFSAARIGYLDNLSGGAVTAVGPTNAQMNTARDAVIAAIPAMVGTNGAALASSWTAALATALGNYNATRAGYLDELDFDLQTAIAAIPTAMVGTNSAFLAAVGGALADAAASGVVTNADTAMAYIKQLVTEGIARDTAIGTVDTVVDGIQTDLSNGTDGLGALKALLDAIPTDAMRGTNSAALASSWTAALATALASYTAVRGGYLDELAAANLPADIDAITAAGPTKAEMDTAHGLLATEAKQDIIDTNVDDIETSIGRALYSMDFWSNPVEEKAVTAAQVTAAVGGAVVVADLPAGATITRAIVMMKFRMIENTNVAANSLDCTAVQPIQVDDSANTGWVSAIDFVDEQFKIAEETRECGDVLIGDNDVAVRVDGNDTYDFQWLNAKAHLANIQFNDIQIGIRIWYSV